MEQWPFALHVEGDWSTAMGYLPKGRNLVNHARREQLQGKLKIHSRATFLGNGDYLYCTWIGEQCRLRIVAGKGAGAAASVSLPGLPDFVSGAVLVSQVVDMRVEPPPGAVNYPVTQPVLRSWVPSPDCARLYGLLQNNRGGPQSSTRLAVVPSPMFDPPDGAYPQAVNEVTFAQTVMQPTMWSGAMRKLVQLLMGFGRPSSHSLYGQTVYEEVQNGDVHESALYWQNQARLQEARTRWQEMVRGNGLQVSYDMRFYRTHGLTKATDGKWWVVEVSVSGVHAMPLPLIEDTTTAAFRAKVEAKGDTMALRALDEFGGFPTGEPFSLSPAWVRSGRVIELLTLADMQGFYGSGWQPYSVLFGWAFNSTGSEAHNVHWRYGGIGDPQEVEHWALALSIGNTRTPPRSKVAAAQLVAAFADNELRQAYKTRFDAAMWKLQWLSEAQLNEVFATGGGLARQFEVLDSLVLDPIAAGSCGMQVMESGKVQCNAHVGYQPFFQCPDADKGTLLSHDFSPAGDPWEAKPVPDFQTTIHVFFANDQLKRVQLAYSSVEMDASSTTLEDECVYVGDWEWGSSSKTYQPFMFVTDDFDDRAPVAEQVQTYRQQGRDVGYVGAGFRDDFTNPQRCQVFRTRGFFQTLVSHYRQGAMLASSVLCPFGDREAYYYAKTTGYAYTVDGIQYFLKSLTDPNQAIGLRPFGAGYNGNPRPECGGAPEDTMGPRCVTELFYDGYPCSELADNGTWLSKCQEIEPLAFDMEPEIPPSSSEVKYNPTVVKAWLVSNWGDSPMLVDEIRYEGGNVFILPNNWFFYADGNERSMWLETTQNVLGDRECLMYWARPNGLLSYKGQLLHGDMVDKSCTFIGVVD